MTLIDRLHDLFAKIGISPKVGDPLIVGAAGVLANWIQSGTFDAGELRLTVATFVMAFVGGIAPPATGVTQHEVNAISKRRG